MGADSLMAMPRAVRMEPERAVQFKAWIVGTEKEPHARHEASPVDVPAHCETAQEVADAIAHDLYKDRAIMVLRTDAAQRPERRNLVHVFSVKRKSAGYDYPKDGGRRRTLYKCFGKIEAQFCVHDGFDPVRPWRVEDSNVAGIDRTLVTR